MRNHLDTRDYPGVSNYPTALDAWVAAPVARTKADQRWLVTGHRDKWIMKHEDLSIGFVRGGREMVCWHPDGSVTLEPWNSTRTFTQFANAFLPHGLRCEWNGPSYVSSLNEPRHWQVIRTTRFERIRSAWRPVEPTEPWEVPELDKAKARRALREQGYNEFVDWARALIALDGWHRAERLSDMTTAQALMDPGTAVGRDHILAAFKNSARWGEILTSPRLTGYTHEPKVALAKAMAAIRMCVYSSENVLSVTREPYLDGSTAVERWSRKRSEYRAALLNMPTR